MKKIKEFGKEHTLKRVIYKKETKVIEKIEVISKQLYMKIVRRNEMIGTNYSIENQFQGFQI